MDQWIDAHLNVPIKEELNVNVTGLNDNDMTYQIVSSNAHTILSVLGLGFNAFVLSSILPKKALHTMANALLCHMALVGVLISLLVHPVLATSALGDSGPFVCGIHGGLQTLLLTARQMSLVALAWDKYSIIARPFHYEKNIQARALTLWVGVAWLAGGIMACLPLFDMSSILYTYMPNHRYCKIDGSADESRWYTFIFVSVVFLAPLLILSFCYFMVFRLTRSHSRRIGLVMTAVTAATDTVQCPLTPIRTTPLIFSRAKRASWTIIIYWGAFFLTNLPFFFVITSEAVLSKNQEPMLVTLVTILFHSGNVVDAFCYGVRKKFLRESFMSSVRTLFAENAIPAVRHEIFALPVINVQPPGVSMRYHCTTPTSIREENHIIKYPFGSILGSNQGPV